MARKADNPVRPAERQRCEFFVVRYVPDAVKDEFVNVGVVLIAEGKDAWADVRFTKDWRRVRCLDPDADVETLEGLEQEIRARLSEGGATREWLLHRMTDTFSNAVQVTAPKAVLADSPQAEIGRLAEMYLEVRRRGARGVRGRQQIVAAMRDEFEKQGVWGLMQKNIPVNRYTHPGDPLRIDCGYSAREFGGGEGVRLYQAVSLEADLNSAKVLAFTYPRLRDGILREQKAETTLTAIVEADLNREDEGIAFALATLGASDINVANVSELPRIGESVRREMRVG